MANWSPSELETLGGTEEIQLSPVLGDGTLRTPVTVWTVGVGPDVFVRAVNGPQAAWYKSALERKVGTVTGGGVKKDVTFVPDAANADVDAAYQAKYAHYSANIVGSVLTAQARAATIKLVPREAIESSG